MQHADIYQCAGCRTCYSGSAEYIFCDVCYGTEVRKVPDVLPF